MTLLRKYRTLLLDGHLVALSAADPLNLLGVFGLGYRLSANTRNRVLYRDREPIAVQEGKQVQFLEHFGTGERWELQKRLVAWVGR